MARRCASHAYLSADSVEVVLWALALRLDPTSAEIRARWGVHKSTAWRWRVFLIDAREKWAMWQRRTSTFGSEAPRLNA